jgi:ABC-type nickel/cobalt efflux system permease component RcnA
VVLGVTALTVILAPTVYLLSTHITQKKIIAGAVLAAGLVIGVAVWLVWRRLRRGRTPSS